MQNMGTDDDGKGVYSENHRRRQNHSDTNTITGDSDDSSFSGPFRRQLSKRSITKDHRSARFIVPDSNADDNFVAAGGGKVEEQDQENRSSSSFRSLIFARNGSSKIEPVSQELIRFERKESATAHAIEGLNFISKTGDANGGWAKVEKRFETLTAGNNGLLNRSQFGECIGKIQNPLSSDLTLFDVLARRRNITGDSINKAQLKDFWDQLADQSFDSRLRTFFDMVDKDADGRISEEEVREILIVSASANKLSNIRDKSHEYAALIMEELDEDQSGYITIEELKALLFQAPQPYTRGESRDPSKELKSRRWMRKTKYLILDNWKRVWVMLLWIGAMAGLFSWKFIQYRNHRSAYRVMGVCVCMAKGAAETLKLNMALILFPVCRNTLTWLRNKTKLGSAVPFDDNIDFHKVIAIAISIGVGIHAVSHLACDFPRLISATPDEYKDLVKFFGKQPESYWHFVKSFEGISGIVMVVLMAIAFTLASPWFRNNKNNLPKSLKKLVGFNAFWYSHHLFVIVYGLLVAHGIKLYLTKEWYKKTTWMYLTVPVVSYACERFVRALRSSIEPVKILKVVVYPGQVPAPKFPGEGDVLALYMSKPRGFLYKSGEYIFVKCSAVSPFEWHPFSITSCPEEEHLSVHIRTLGDWTGKITTVFSQLCEKPQPDNKSGILRADFFKEENIRKVPKVSVDGPYGAPSQDYKDYEVVLLVGLGIGATPMISIVKDIMNNIKAIETVENDGYDALESGNRLAEKKRKGGSTSAAAGGNNFRTRRAYFYWMAREQGSFEWFKEVMNEVAEMDKKGVVEMHLHCTSVYEEGDARSAVITLLQSLYHAKNSVDVVTGTHVKSHFARPKWNSVYNRIALNHPNKKVGVFYCGNPTLTKELKYWASDVTQKTSTKFEFHAENF